MGSRTTLIVGLIILTVLGGGVYLALRPKTNPRTITATSPTPTPNTFEKISNSFKVTIPSDREKVELKDISNEGKAYSAIATRKYTNNRFDFSLLADLPAPDQKSYYQVWLTKDTEMKLMGTMISGKGGYMLETSKSEDLTSYKGISVTRETKLDNSAETKLLDGQF